MLAAYHHHRMLPGLAAVTIAAIPILGVEAARRSSTSTATWNPGFATHPVGVIPSAFIAIPAGWPRDARGAITCTTCHLAIPSDGVAADPQLRDFEPGSSPTTASSGYDKEYPMALIRCPTCGKWHKETGAKSAPFCSERCQQVDLYRWLNEDYAVPAIDAESLEDELPEQEDSH